VHKLGRLGLVLGLGVLLAGGAAGAVSPIERLVQSERDFSSLSERADMRTAFLEFLAEDGIVFGPDGPTNGKKFWQGLTPPESKLAWRPVHAGLAASGDLGFTTGPYEMTRAGLPPRYGWYASVWRLQQDGSWKVLCDLGATVKRPATDPADWSGSDAPAAPASAYDPVRARKALMERERDLAAHETLAAPDIVLLRDDVEPAVGRDAAIAALPAGVRWEAVGGDVSGSGDLGYVYGRFKSDGANGWYLRVWRREADAWQIVLESLHQTGS
jgi:ketosteroid isomerase-like protein